MGSCSAFPDPLAIIRGREEGEGKERVWNSTEGKKGGKRRA